MQTLRRDALRLLGLGVGSSVLSGSFIGKASAEPPAAYVDQWCYCSDILAAVPAADLVQVLGTGPNHTLWASSIKREVEPGIWVGRSVFTNKESIRLKFVIDAKRHYIDYLAERSGNWGLVNWARAVPGELMGYPKGTSIAALYQTRGAKGNLDLNGRIGHDSEMFRIKALAEKGKPAAADTLPPGSYLNTASEVVNAPASDLMAFVSDATAFGKWTWGRAPRTKVGDTFLCKSDFGEPDVYMKVVADRENKTVDYFTGPKPDALLLNQSARVFEGPVFGHDAKASFVTFTRWRAAGQREYDWQRMQAGQVQDARMVKTLLENGVRAG
jgi:hypothetical protein